MSNRNREIDRQEYLLAKSYKDYPSIIYKVAYSQRLSSISGLLFILFYFLFFWLYAKRIENDETIQLMT